VAGKAFIADIKDRDRVAGHFLVQQKQVPLNKNGKPYIAMVIMDRSGTMEARVWDNVELVSPQFDAGDFIEIRAMAVSYQNRVQLKVENASKLDPADLDLEEYLPISPRDRGEMIKQLESLLSSIKDPGLNKLCLGCLQDPNFRQSFIKTPAAKTIHHAYLGGLLEHTLAVVEMAAATAKLYPETDRDLLLAGAFFHDIGKMRELGSNNSFEYTDQGRLLGHIVMGSMMLQDLAQAHPGISEETLMKLTHIILSHHGSYEFGSPKRPKFTEALIVNFLDEMDSKIQTFKQIAERDAGNRWSSYQRLFDRYLYLGKDAESSPEPAPTKAGPTERDPTARNDPLPNRALADQLQAGTEPERPAAASGEQMSLVVNDPPHSEET